jgi:RING-box protein 1
MSQMSDTSGSSSSSSSSSSGKKRARVQIKSLKLVANWTYDVENESCAICQSPIASPCIMCDADPAHAEQCVPTWGECRHAYHFHCINKWLKTRSTCPLDDTEWNYVS